MKKSLSIFTLLLLMAFTVQAQDANNQKKPDWMRWHYLSEEEMYDHTRGMNFVETDPPTGEPRFVAEFEPMQGVMIRYPLGIPTSLVVQLANNCHVYCIVSTSYQGQAQSSFQSAGVNMSNVTFVNAQSDSYWVRDYGPWYIFEDRNPAIVDNIYNRPRPNDDNMSQVFANFWNIPMYGMRIEHTGGNMMEDGRGHGVSDDLVFQENMQHYGINEATVRQRMSDYLGIDPYHVTIDPQGDYIAHVDCWGKYLAPDKILIARLPQSNPRYQYYEQVAEYFETTNCCWGYPYRVYRVDEPGGYTLAPYTNSLILNKTVYVPMGTNSTYNNDALAVYQQAMPGYEIIGVNGGSAGWENTDALHCRTRGVMDFDMLFVDHRNVLFGEQEWQDSIPVVSKFIAYSGSDLKQDSLLIYYSIDGGTYQVAHMTATGNPDEYVGYIKGYQGESEINYYVFGADESGHRYTQPVFADLDPHHFTVGEHQPTGEFIVTPDTLYFENNEAQSISLINETNEAVVISAMNQPDNTAVYANIWYEGQIIGNVLPLTIQPGQTIQVDVDFVSAPYPNKSNYYSNIDIVSSAGNRRVDLVISDSIWGGLLSFEDIWLENYEYVTGTVFNYYLSSVVINEIYEQETDYLIIDSEPMPVSVPSLSSFTFKVKARENRKGYIDTKIVLSTDHGDVFITVHINNELLSVTELSAEAKLYPNPTTGQFTVEGANVARVDVYNLVGQKVCEQQGNKVVNIDATDWNKGIYLVNIIEENGAVVTKKLVVK
ncbi:MAG: agmatine deiminase family protein [Bacteroidales bacterium]|nr:agmatine deiminase family protein [Bacteroidales bacterium]